MRHMAKPWGVRIALISLAATFGIAGLSTGAAQAAPITVPFVCTTNAFGVNYDNGIVDYTVTMTSPSTATSGDLVPVTYSFSPAESPLPFALTSATVSATATVTTRAVSGGPTISTATASGSALSGQTIPAFGTLPAPQPVTVPVPTSVALTSTAIAFVPGTFTFVIQTSNELPPNSSITCTPQGTPETGAVTSLTGQPSASQTDRCIAYNSNQSGGPGCDTTQFVTVSVQPGRLVQRAYTNTTPASGVGVIDGSAITTPIAGTGTVNSGPTQVNLGSITSPLAPTLITGRLNDITVSDNRGSSFGWSLTANVTDPDAAGPLPASFNGTGGNTIAATALSISPTCSAATNSTAWDYDAPGQTAIAGFDSALIAPGFFAGSANQQFGSSVTLCNKSTLVNTTTQSTGGVYNVGGTLGLVVPAFQAADRYTAVVTITLA
jgi:hypothetical protein